MTFYVESEDKQFNLYDIQGVQKKVVQGVPKKLLLDFHSSVSLLPAFDLACSMLMISRSEAARQTGESRKAIFWETLFSKKEQINSTEDTLYFFTSHYRLQQIPNLSYMAVVERTKYGQVGFPEKIFA